jgi:hypothetical protein
MTNQAEPLGEEPDHLTGSGCVHSQEAVLLPGSDQPASSDPVSGVAVVVFSCGARLFEPGLSEFRKPQVAGSIPVAGSSHLKPFRSATVLGDVGPISQNA